MALGFDTKYGGKSESKKGRVTRSGIYERPLMVRRCCVCFHVLCVYCFVRSYHVLRAGSVQVGDVHQKSCLVCTLLNSKYFLANFPDDSKNQHVAHTDEKVYGGPQLLEVSRAAIKRNVLTKAFAFQFFAFSGYKNSIQCQCHSSVRSLPSSTFAFSVLLFVQQILYCEFFRRF